MNHKISVCECSTCKEIKKRIANPRCSYCGEHHDPRVNCMAEMKQRENYMLNAKPDICPEVPPFFEKLRSTEQILMDKKIKELKKTSEHFLDVADGKYSLYQKKNGTLKVLRYGEPCKIVKNDNLIFNMMVELIEAKEKIAKALDALKLQEYSIPVEIVETILKGEK